jgi:hypothetical protein
LAGLLFIVFEFVEEGSGKGVDESFDRWFVGIKEAFENITILRFSGVFVMKWGSGEEGYT